MQHSQHPKWRRYIPLAIIASVVSIAGVLPAQAASGFWFTEAPMPTAAFGSATAVYNGQLFVISGNQTGGGTTTVNQVYDPASDTWTSQAPIPTGVVDANAGTIGKKIYVAGGCAANGLTPRIAVRNAIASVGSSAASGSGVRFLPMNPV